MTPAILSTLLFLFTPYKEGYIEIVIPTVEAETEYVWQTISDIQFFEQYKYQLALPEGSIIQELKEKSRRGQLQDTDYDLLLEHMRAVVYKVSDYQKGYDKIEANKALINKMIHKFRQIKKDWDYKTFDKYKVTLTLYGPGGSYDPFNGSILIYTTKAGAFKQYENPANTIIHEVVHIGTEASIINKYNVPHPLKERIIDHLVMINFSSYLPEYQLQGFGDARIDPYLQNKKDVKQLEMIVKKFQQKHR
jgi:hypothetical protein